MIFVLYKIQFSYIVSLSLKQWKEIALNSIDETIISDIQEKTCPQA